MLDKERIKEKMERCMLTQREIGHVDQGHVDPRVLYLIGYFRANQLRALANAIDGFEEATAAAMEDLKQDSPAYQRGLVDGKSWFVEQLNCWMDDGSLWVEQWAAGPGDPRWAEAAPLECGEEIRELLERKQS